MPKLVAFLFSAVLAGSAVAAAEGPRKVWTAAEVIAVSGGTPPAEAVAAEAAAEQAVAQPAQPAVARPAARAKGGKTKPLAKKAGVKAKKKAGTKQKRKAPAAKARR